MTMANKLTEQNLEEIARFLTERFPVLRGHAGRKSSSQVYEIEIRERTIRVEEELKNQRVLTHEMMVQIDKRFEQIEKRFEQVDKRFEQVDKRFEQVDKRFEQVDKRFEQIDKRFEDMDKRFNSMMWFTGIGFTLVTAFITAAMALMRP